ncbi:MAG TPA: isoprenyl transferase [Armatimonadota bacterium]|nr:isoprenyl transferase [Armatimonadota bacterium]
MQLAELEPSRIPRHIAIIMDGNGRWARQRGYPRVEGHRRGELAVRRVVELCGELGVEHLTLYTFSAENWRRSQEEVGALMRLIEVVARKEIGELHRKGVRLRVMGRLHELPQSLQDELQRDVALTRENTGLNLNLAINYGGRAEIVDAARRLAERVSMGVLRPDDITEEALARELYNPGMPDPDLLIRTGGEMRLSNFLLWQAAYSEIWVTNTLWPDFGRAELAEAVRSYQARERRFGGVLEPAAV